MSNNFSASASSSSSSSSCYSPPVWLLSYLKLHFFKRIRRFLRHKAPRKRCIQSVGQADKPSSSSSSRNNTVLMGLNNDGIQVLERPESFKDENESLVLQKSVKKLHFGSWEEKEMAAKEIERLAKEDVMTRKLMAELGVVQMLVSMVATEVVGLRQVAVRALIELANGTYTNKALIVEAGIFSKLPKKISNIDESSRHDFAELLLSLSSLANTQFPLASSQILPCLVEILESNSSGLDTKELCLGTLYNLSKVLENSGPFVSSGVVDTLLKLSLVKELSEKALATLGHLVVSLMGKKAMENSSMVPESLIEILTWEDKPKCQELSAYILMILAHQSYAQREKMAELGIVHVLLEVALMGSPLAQKRALKLLQWFKDERQAKMGPHSGPQTARIAMGSPVNPREAQEGKKLMKNLVKQSLHKNMEMITRRANNASTGDSHSRLKALVISTSSKSLPY